MSPFVKEEYFGGRDALFKYLMDVGLISSTCQLCGNKTLRLHFVKDQVFPKTYCTTCSRTVPSCRNGSIFDRFVILFIPVFLFLLRCFILGTTMETMSILAGVEPET